LVFCWGQKGKTKQWRIAPIESDNSRNVGKSHSERGIIVKKSTLREFTEDFLFALAAIGGLILITAFLFAITPAVPRP